jgi:Domain of unknown function (DUF4286)
MTPFVYSVTILLEEDYKADWLEWMRATHIPAVLATGCFVRHRILHLLTPESEPGSVTFSVQYECSSQMQLQRYLDEFAPALQADYNARYGGHFKAFRTVLEVLT